ncbi:MAG: DUF6340 family protein [Tannerellaceae bacterium]|nr:DUF6340 family protein [Tannerellaceae bacterium]MCD8265067.1 DUF6340 family protein [Tannerellaceae bacterium]
MIKKIAACFVIVYLLTACSTLTEIAIDTYNPAEITFPEDVSTILIVNNAVAQPRELGYEYSFMGVLQDTCKLPADSTLFDACRALGITVAEIGFFNDVLLYHLPTRTDDQYFSDKRLTLDRINQLSEENEADAIISLDRLLFKMTKTVTALAEGYLVGVINVSISAVLRTYLPGREQPLATVLVNDSIYWSEMAYNHVLLGKLLPTPEEALREAARYIGIKSQPNFSPHWQSEARWYYTGTGALWKEGTAFAKAGKWNEAISRWKRIYDAASSWKPKARAASNLALAYECKDQLNQSYEWAATAAGLFKENGKAADDLYKLQQLYKDVLEKRVHADKKLILQIGEQ